MDVPAAASGLMSVTRLPSVASGGSISLAGLFPITFMLVTKYFAIDSISHCSWQVGFLIEQQVYWILGAWTCLSVKINKDRWRTKAGLKLSLVAVSIGFSMESFLGSNSCHGKDLCSQIPCANIGCILSKPDLGMILVCSVGWSIGVPHRMHKCGGKECHRYKKGSSLIPLRCLVWTKLLVVWSM